MLKSVTYARVIAVESTINTVNPYLPQKGITYDLSRRGNSYVLSVSLPGKHVSCDDRVMILEWLHSYRTQVLKSNPNWCANFNASKQGYTLEICPVKDLKDMASCHGNHVRDLWHRTLSYGG
jgi:hypothetical protein